MVDLARRVSPLAHWTFDSRPPSVRIEEVPFLTQLSLRVDARSADGVEKVLGGPLPTEPCTAVTHGDVQVLWLGPDEWLVVTGPDQQKDLEQRIRDESTGAAVTDVSAQRTALTLTGPGVRDVIAGGCAIDLHPTVSPPGTCVQTLLAQTGVILVVESSGVLLLVRSSFADYLARWLVDAASALEPAL
jgi:sarcosine oxidase subunit gamma